MVKNKKYFDAANLKSVDSLFSQFKVCIQLSPHAANWKSVYSPTLIQPAPLNLLVFLPPCHAPGSFDLSFRRCHSFRVSLASDEFPCFSWYKHLLFVAIDMIGPHRPNVAVLKKFANASKTPTKTQTTSVFNKLAKWGIFWEKQCWFKVDHDSPPMCQSMSDRKSRRLRALKNHPPWTVKIWTIPLCWAKNRQLRRPPGNPPAFFPMQPYPSSPHWIVIFPISARLGKLSLTGWVLGRPRWIV